MENMISACGVLLIEPQLRVAQLEKMVPETEYKLVIKPTRTHECGPE